MSLEKGLRVLEIALNEGVDLAVAAKIATAYLGEPTFLGALARHPKFCVQEIMEAGGFDALLALGPKLSDEDVVSMLRCVLCDMRTNPNKTEMARAIVERLALAAPPLKPFLFELATGGMETSRPALLKWAAELDKETPLLEQVVSDILGEKEFVEVKHSHLVRSELGTLIKAAKAGKHPPEIEKRLQDFQLALRLTLDFNRSSSLAGSIFLAEEIPFSRKPLKRVIRYLGGRLAELIVLKPPPENPLAYPRLALLTRVAQGGVVPWLYADLERAEEATRRIMGLVRNYRNKYGKNPLASDIFGREGEFAFYEFDERRRLKEKQAEDEHEREREERAKPNGREGGTIWLRGTF